jgi:acetyltransferase EpsM
MADPQGRPLLLLGSGLFAVEVADVVSAVPEFRVKGFVNNLAEGPRPTELAGWPVFCVEDLAAMPSGHCALGALGTTKRQRFIEQVAALGIPFATIIHPSAVHSASAAVGTGTLIGVRAVLAAHACLGRHGLVNRGALIGHHTAIGDYVTIGPGANIAGSCRVGDATYIGMGAIVLDHITIGAHSLVGAGAVVTKDVPDHVAVVGAPARIVQENFPGK